MLVLGAGLAETVETLLLRTVDLGVGVGLIIAEEVKVEVRVDEGHALGVCRHEQRVEIRPPGRTVKAFQTVALESAEEVLDVAIEAREVVLVVVATALARILPAVVHFSGYAELQYC